MVFPDLEKRALEIFVTSADAPIYAVKHTVPPEVFGAFGSYFSRNPKDLREHLLDAIRGEVEGEESDVGEKNLKELAEGKFRDSGEAIETGLAKSQDFFKRWYGKYSHKSIANVVPLTMVGTNVSQLFAKELAYDQLAFFIEQSTRYVKWDLDSMFIDPNVASSNYGRLLSETLGNMIKDYHNLNEEATNFYRKEIPFEKWKEWQSEDTLIKSEKFQKRKYERETAGAALDVARFLLPQACKTNISWILDARSTEFDIAAWKGHPLQEIRDSALLIEAAAGEIAPSLLKYTEKNNYYGRKLQGYDREFSISAKDSFEKGVDVISHDANAMDHTLAHMFKRHNFGGTFRHALERVQKMEFDQKINLLRETVKDRGSHDEWVAMDEELDLVKIAFEVRTDIGAIRDWRRHQKWDRGESLYSLSNGVHRPAVLDNMDEKAGRLFDESIEIAYDTEEKIRGAFPYQAQYVAPMATMHSLTFSGGLDQLQYMLWTRSTPQGNFSYREDAFKIAEAVVKVHPWMLGYEKYPNGKGFKEVYDEAPLKGFLNLQTGETTLHV